MRYLIGGAALLLAALATGAVFLLQYLLDEERLAARSAEAVRAWTGHALAATAGVDLEFLPQPVLTIHQPRLGAIEAGFALTADRLDLDLETWPLLMGSVVVRTASLVRPEWRIGGDPGPLLAAFADRLAAHGPGLPLQRLRFVGGRVATLTGEPVLLGIEAVLERQGAGSDFRGTARAVAGGTELTVEGRLGHAAAGRPLPLQLQIAGLREGVAQRLDFRGQLRPAPAMLALGGRVTLDGSGPADRLLAELAGFAPGLARLPPPDLPWHLEADLELGLGDAVATLHLDQATLTLGEQTLTGTLGLEGDDASSIELVLEADRLALPAEGPDSASLAALLPPALAGTITFRAPVVEWRGRAFRQVALDLVLDGRGMADVARATAVLPGPGDLAFTGRFGPLGGEMQPGLAGRLEAAVQAPAELWGAFAEPPALIGRTTTATLAADLDWQPARLTLQHADLALDALQASGGLAYRPASGDRLPQLALRAVADRLALDDLLDPAAPAAALEALLDAAAATDLALDLRVSRTGLGQARFGGLVLRLDSNDGAVTIERASLDDIAGSAASVDGRVHAPSRTFELGLALDVSSLSRLLRLIGEEPPMALALLGPLNLRGDIAGDLDRAEATAVLDADLFGARGTASITDWQNGLSGAVSLRVEAAEASTLLRQFGGVTVTDPLLEGPLEAELELDLEAGSPGATVLELSLGELVVALAAERRAAGPGPLDRFDLRLDRLSSATAALLYRLLTPPLELVPGPPTRWPGYWPSEPLTWDWMQVPETDVSVTLQGVDPALPPLELRAQLRDGTLTVPALRWASPHGLVDAGMAMAARADGRGVDLTLDLALERFEVAQLLEFADAASAPLGGTLDLEARLATQGRSIRALIGNLEGALDLVLSDGVLGAASPTDGGIPIERLTGALVVERGVVEPAAPGITFSGPDGVGEVTGSADLLAWMIDLELALDGHDGTPLVRQHLFGPLAEPEALQRSPALAE